MKTKWSQIVSAVAGLLVGLLIGHGIGWNYYAMPTALVRVNRLTGRAEICTYRLGSGWLPLSAPWQPRELTDREVGLTNPYDALPEAKPGRAPH